MKSEKHDMNWKTVICTYMKAGLSRLFLSFLRKKETFKNFIDAPRERHCLRGTNILYAVLGCFSPWRIYKQGGLTKDEAFFYNKKKKKRNACYMSFLVLRFL